MGRAGHFAGMRRPGAPVTMGTLGCPPAQPPPAQRPSAYARTRDGVEVVVLDGVIGALEHVKHALRDGEAAANVDRAGQHREGSQAGGSGVGQVAAAHQHHAAHGGQACEWVGG